jgi:hypothetical protein
MSAQSGSSAVREQAHHSLYPEPSFLVCEVCAPLWTTARKADTGSRCGQVPRKLDQNAWRFLLEPPFNPPCSPMRTEEKWFYFMIPRLQSVLREVRLAVNGRSNRLDHGP